MIAPPAIQAVVPAISPPDFYFLGTQSHRVAFLHQHLTNGSNPASLSPLTPFVEAVFFAKSRVFILDAFFNHEHGLPALFAEDAILESQARFRVISRQPFPDEWLKERPDWSSISSHVSACLVWRRHDHPWFHGRFAIVDDVLWHFGSTVGGAHPSFDAATRWADPDLVTAFEYRFKKTWGPDQP
jgi:hypothetical protein